MMVFIENPNLLIKEFNEMAEIAQKKTYITIGIELQKQEVETIELYRKDLLELKKEFVERKLENEANLVYCIEKSLCAVQLELQMLVNIKEDNMHGAWANLVNAQTIYETVVSNSPYEFQAPYGYLERLNAYEKLLFPDLFFQSVGGIIRKCYCSICKQDFKECDHIKGKLYYGELCCRVIEEMEVEEVSFVTNPANKHARILSIKQDDKEIDILTLREIVNDKFD